VATQRLGGEVPVVALERLVGMCFDCFDALEMLVGMFRMHDGRLGVWCTAFEEACCCCCCCCLSTTPRRLATIILPPPPPTTTSCRNNCIGGKLPLLQQANDSLPAVA
jgi:hypothetical protein